MYCCETVVFVCVFVVQQSQVFKSLCCVVEERKKEEKSRGWEGEPELYIWAPVKIICVRASNFFRYDVKILSLLPAGLCATKVLREELRVLFPQRTQHAQQYVLCP